MPATEPTKKIATIFTPKKYIAVRIAASKRTKTIKVAMRPAASAG